MKKSLLSLIAILFMVNFMSAQNCTPDPQYTAPGVYPDSATGLPPAYVGIPYAETITEVVPADTTVPVPPFNIPTTLPIDSIVVDTFVGLPAGFTVVAENQNTLPFTFLGNSSSCMLITGTATAPQVGNYPLHVSGLAWVRLLGVPTSQPFSIDYYSLDVLSAVGVQTFSRNKFELGQNMPNPFNDVSTIQYYLPVANNVEINIFNILGKVVKSESIAAHGGENLYKLNANDFTNGIYFYRLTYQNNTITKRFIVNK